MTLKGSAVIELTDVRTGHREIVKHDNLVTTAIDSLLNELPPSVLYGAGYNFNSKLLPVIPNLIGGILLYTNALAEQPSMHYAPNDNTVVGYSSNEVNSGEDIKRGSLNLTESGVLEDGSGYRFVFDFANTQGNGTIHALSLTSRLGGFGAVGSNMTSFVGNMLTSDESEDWPVKHAAITSIEPDKEVAYAVYLTEENTVTIDEIECWNRTISLMRTLKPGEVRATHTLTTNSFGVGSNPWYAAFCDGGDGFIYGFQHSGNTSGNSTGSATILYIKISKSDWSFTEGSFTIPAQIWALGCQTNRNLNTNFIVQDGQLYLVKYDKSGVLKVNLENPSDVVELDNSDGITVVVPNTNTSNYTTGSGTTSAEFFYNGCAFNCIGNILYFANGFIENGRLIQTAERTTITKAPYGYGNHCCGRPNVQVGPYVVWATSQWGYRETFGTVHLFLSWMTPYLATINNLDTPVTKTADKTMKITYILREE